MANPFLEHPGRGGGQRDVETKEGDEVAVIRAITRVCLTVR